MAGAGGFAGAFRGIAGIPVEVVRINDMTQKTARLQRWLDRLAAACESKKWKSAVAEADCLSAELRHVREELWEQAEGINEPTFLEKIRGYASFNAKSAGIALAIVCLCSFPIAIESGSPNAVAALPTGAENKFEEFTLVTVEEKELLQLLRRNLNESNVTIRAADKRTPTEAKTLTARAVERPSTNDAVKSEPQINKEGKIKPEELLTLIQIGEKSLRGDTPAIKIIN